MSDDQKEERRKLAMQAIRQCEKQRVPAVSQFYEIEGGDRIVRGFNYGGALGSVNINFGQCHVELSMHDASSMVREVVNLMSIEKKTPLQTAPSVHFFVNGTPTILTRFFKMDEEVSARCVESGDLDKDCLAIHEDGYVWFCGAVTFKIRPRELTHIVEQLKKVSRAMHELDSAYRAESDESFVKGFSVISSH